MYLLFTNFNYVILNYKLMNYFPIDKFSEFCQLGMINVIHRLVVTNQRFSWIDELCLTVLWMNCLLKSIINVPITKSRWCYAGLLPYHTALSTRQSHSQAADRPKPYGVGPERILGVLYSSLASRACTSCLLVQGFGMVPPVGSLACGSGGL